MVVKHFVFRQDWVGRKVINSKQDRLVIPFYQTKIGVSSLHYQGFKLWNDIPFVLKSKLYIYTIFAKEFQKTLSNDTCHTVLKVDSTY